MTNALICHFFNRDYDQVEYVPITQYRIMYNQALNIGNFISGNGALELQTEKERTDQMKKEYKYLKDKGLL